jgi:hypothetical protein
MHLSGVWESVEEDVIRGKVHHAGGNLCIREYGDLQCSISFVYYIGLFIYSFFP